MRARLCRCFALSLGCFGIASAAPPSTSLDLPAFLPDGVSSTLVPLTPAQTWRAFSFTLEYPAAFNDLTFLDLDSELSETPVSFALFDSSGELVTPAISRGSGPDVAPSASGNNAYQLSFGVPARAAVQNGLAYSGQEGDIPSGLYYVIVAPSGSVFADNWSVVTPPIAVPYAGVLNLRSNCRRTSPAGPAPAPPITGGADLGIVTQEGPGDAVLTVCGGEVAWLRISLTNTIATIGEVDARDGTTPLRDVTYLDISQVGSDVNVGWNMALYAWSGFLATPLAVSRAGAGYNSNPGGGDGPWGGGGTFAQLSFGVESPRPASPLTPGQSTAGLSLANQNGSHLDADQYYLAVTSGDAAFQPTRFGARNIGLGCATLHIQVRTNNRGPSLDCEADFNGDKVVDDRDFVLFAKGYSNYFDLLGDLDGNQVVDDDDFFIFAGKYSDFLCP